MPERSRLSPETRRRQADEIAGKGFARVQQIGTRIIVGVYTSGFTFAGNFAYLSLLAVFAFFLVAAAIVTALGKTEIGIDFVLAFLQTVPPSVAIVLREPIVSAMSARTGALLWMSAAVGLWTTTSLIETIREILNNAYGTSAARAFWQYRLGAIAAIVGTVFLAMAALSANFLLSGIRELVNLLFPSADAVSLTFLLSSIFPFLVLFLSIYILFRLLTPRSYRSGDYPKWPGAIFISLWWLGIVYFLPLGLRYAANYELTYGSLAGVMITLIFFYLVGLGMVIGAQLNAALAEKPSND